VRQRVGEPEHGDATAVTIVVRRRVVAASLWGGPARGIVGLHAWTFVAVPGGVRVYTEESWSGPAVEADVTALQAALDASLVAWLRHLKSTAEQQAA